VTDEFGLLGIMIAALGGAAVGAERERSGHATGRYARFGGIRTFTLLGGTAGVAGWLTTLQFAGLGAVLAAGAVALVIAGYVAASDREVEATTEAAALVVIAAGVAAGLGWLALASGMIAVCVLALVEKSRLHSLVRRINDSDMRAAARFGVMAVVILPLLPEGPFGPAPGIRPRELWLLVLFFTGLSFLGYIARRVMGAGSGYPVAGLLGGLISSTNVTFTYARLSRHEHQLAELLAIGAGAASTMLFPRVLVAATVLNPSVAWHLLPYAAAPFVVGAAASAFWWRRGRRRRDTAATPSNPLHVVPAIQMALVFQVVLFVVHAMGQRFGGQGSMISGAVLGLTDVDALTISMTKTAVADEPQLAARAIAVGILSNCLLKAGIAAAVGAGRFRWVAALLVVMALVIGVLVFVQPGSF
jgi:uncharacterized membrane protein (DUF4010 family)